MASVKVLKDFGCKRTCVGKKSPTETEDFLHADKVPHPPITFVMVCPLFLAKLSTSDSRKYVYYSQVRSYRRVAI